MGDPIPAALIEAARTGDAEAIEGLVNTVWPGAYRLARAMLGDEQRAQDAAQEACIVLYRTIASLRSSAAFRTWFYRIVVREAAAIKRRAVRIEPPAEERAAPGDPATSIDVWRALATLTHPLREVIVLRYFEDLPSPEIGSVLGIPDGTVRFRLAVARRRLRPLLDIDAPSAAPASREVRTSAI